MNQKDIQNIRTLIIHSIFETQMEFHWKSICNNALKTDLNYLKQKTFRTKYQIGNIFDYICSKIIERENCC